MNTKQSGVDKLEKRNRRSKNKKFVALLIVVIIITVTIAETEIIFANIVPEDLEVTILQTNVDEKTHLAQMTIYSQLDQLKIPMKLKTPTTSSDLRNELLQFSNTSILVIIGHGKKDGLSIGNKTIPWSKCCQR